MSIDKFILSKLTQPIVYWGNPVDNGYGEYSYDDPVQLYGRWEELNDVVMGTNGKEQVSQARVFLSQEVDEQGAMWLGLLTDLESDPFPTDSSVAALHIVATSRLPKLGSTTMDAYRVYLNMTGRGTV